MRSDEYDTAKILKRLQRQVSGVRAKETDESVTLLQTLTDTVDVGESIGFSEHAVAFGGLGTDDALFLDTDYGSPQTFTISLFLKPTTLDTEWRTLVDSGERFISVTTGGAIDFRVPGVETSSFEAGQVAADEVAHLSVSYDGDERQTTLDGEHVASETIGSGTVNWNALRVGGNGTSANAFAGVIDDVMIHDRALSLAERTQLAAHVPITDGLVGGWSLDAGPGHAPTDDVTGQDGALEAGAEYAAPIEWEYDPGFVWGSDPWSTDAW